MNRPPARCLYCLLERLVDEPAFQSVITPIFADLDHEVHAADRATARLIAHLRCYIALMRVCASGGGCWRTPMKRLIVTLGLSAAGAGTALWVAIRGTFDDTLMMVFLPMAILVPVTLRALNAGRSFRHVLQSCLTVGWLMTAALYVYKQPGEGPIVFLRMGAAFAWVGTACLLIAVAASAREPGSKSIVRRSAVALLTGALCSMVVGAAVRLSLTYSGPRFGVLSWLGFAAFQSFVFAAAASIFLVPLVLVARRGVRNRWLLALLSGVAFPIPLLGLLIVAMEGNIGQAISRYDPFAFTVFVLPYVAACMAIGWVFAIRPERAELSTQ